MIKASNLVHSLLNICLMNQDIGPSQIFYSDDNGSHFQKWLPVVTGMEYLETFVKEQSTK